MICTKIVTVRLFGIFKTGDLQLLEFYHSVVIYYYSTSRKPESFLFVCLFLPTSLKGSFMLVLIYTSPNFVKVMYFCGAED